MAVIKNVNKYFIRSDGTFFPAPENSSKLYPNANNANILEIYLEDGISENTFVQVSFLLEGKFITNWLPLFPRGAESREIDTINVSFQRFATLVSGNVLQNASPTTTKEIGIQVRQVYGEDWLGTFNVYSSLPTLVTLTSITTEPVATNDQEIYFNSTTKKLWTYELFTDSWIEERDPVVGTYYVFDGSIYLWDGTDLVLENENLFYSAYVLASEGVNLNGFYQIQFNTVTDLYAWTLVELANTYQEVKSYGMGSATLQKGFVNPKGTVSITDAIQNLIFLELSNITQDFSQLQTDVAELDLNKLEKIFTEYDEKITYNKLDLIAINDSETESLTSKPKYLLLEYLMQAENVSYESVGTFFLTEETNAQGAIDTLDTELKTVKDDLQTHEDELGINTHNESATTIPFTPTLKLASTTTQDAIEEVQDNLDDYETSNDLRVGNIEDGTTIVKKAEQDKDGNDIVDTYETKTNATTERAKKVDKHLSGYDLVTLADNQNIYVQDNANYRRATIGNLKTFIAQNFVGFGFVIADDDGDGLPDVAEPETNKIYLVLTSEPEQDNIYNEFIWVNETWELIGTTQVDLSGVVKGVIVDDLILNFDVNQRVKIPNVIASERDGLMSKEDKNSLDEIKSDIDLLYEEFIGGE